MSRIRVAILRGGLSNEYTASLWTGAAVIENIDKSVFEPIDVIITKSGEWLLSGKTYLPEHILQSVDVVFNALHGVYGEDGTVQRLIERYGVPYTGSKAFSSALGMNKVLTKNFLKDAPVKLPQHVHITKDALHEVPRIAENIVDCFGPQYIIKPVSSGASTGTMMVKNPLLLNQAITDALNTYDEIIVETKIPGREATCGVIERYRGRETYVLPPVEIVIPTDADFYSEEVKANRRADEFCPSRFTLEIKNEIEKLAKLVHHTLGLSQYSRSDFIVADDGIYFLEVNSQPQLTPSSIFSKSIEAVGGTYADFITHLLTDALQRHPHR